MLGDTGFHVRDTIAEIMLDIFPNSAALRPDLFLERYLDNTQWLEPDWGFLTILAITAGIPMGTEAGWPTLESESVLSSVGRAVFRREGMT